jgi:RNA polymerase sigma factor (sigma-70 family)
MGPTSTLPAENLCALADEELVALVAEHGHAHPATNVLLLRHHGWAAAHAAERGRRWGLADDLLQDAMQDAVLAVLEAIRQYDPVQLGQQRRCRFRTFLWTVLEARLTDWLRRYGRKERRLDRSVDVRDLLSEEGQRGVSTAWRRGWPADGDPAQEAAQRDLLAHLREALERLPAEARLLLEETAAGTSMRVLAVRMGSTYDILKKWRKRLLGRLAAELGGKEAD